MLKMMIHNNYGFKWNSFYRSDHGDAETIELMAKEVVKVFPWDRVSSDMHWSG